MSKFKNKIIEEDYKIFDEDTPIKKKEIDRLRKEIKEILRGCIESFRDALEVEDINDNGYLPIEKFKSVIKQMEIKLSKVHVEYLIYEMYKVSKNSRKLNYSRVFELFDDNYIPPKKKEVEENREDEHLTKNKSVKSNEQSKEEVKETTPDVLATDPGFARPRETPKNIKENAEHADLPTNVQNDREENSNRENTINDTMVNQDTQHNFDTANSKFVTDQTSEDLGEGENGDDYISDEEMIRIAEN